MVHPRTNAFRTVAPIGFSLGLIYIGGLLGLTAHMIRVLRKEAPTRSARTMEMERTMLVSLALQVNFGALGQVVEENSTIQEHLAKILSAVVFF